MIDPTDTRATTWRDKYAQPAQDIRDLRDALAAGEYDFAQFEMADPR